MGLARGLRAPVLDYPFALATGLPGVVATGTFGVMAFLWAALPGSPRAIAPKVPVATTPRRACGRRVGVV